MSETNGQVAMAEHPAARLFPLMDDDQLATLREDVRTNGLLQPISRLPDGRIIDGRNRLRVCMELGIPPKFETVDPEDPVAFVISRNLARRHLSASQRATIAAEAMPLLQAQARERMREGGQRGGSTPRGKGMQKVAHPSEAPSVRRAARDEAARLAGSNHEYVDRAVRLKQRAPDLFDQVKRGTVSLATAARQASAQSGVEDPPKRRKPTPPKTGVRAEQIRRKEYVKACEYEAHIAGVAVVCNGVSVEAIRSDALLLRQWTESCRSAISALQQMLRQLRDRQ